MREGKVKVKSIRLCLCIIALLVAPSVRADVVISEIHYNPVGSGFEAGSLKEFVEIYNPGAETVDFSGYAFTDGIRYTFAENTTLAANSYLVLARDPTHSTWRRASYAIVGPYEGKLSDSGERIALTRSDGSLVERVSYEDSTPWPRSSDGYGPSLERVAWDTPSDDYHSWRASTGNNGTPGRANSTAGTIPRPMIAAFEVTPAQPTSQDAVTIRFGFDTPHEIASAELLWERLGATQAATAMVSQGDVWRYWKGRSDPSDGIEWTKAEFDDSSWSSGRGGFGYGDTAQLQTILTDMQNNYTTVYIRRRFTVEDPSTDSDLELRIYYDDGYVCYLNGREVSRQNAPDTVRHNSVAPASHEYTNLSTFLLGSASDLLVAGENVIALVGVNVGLSSSDLVLAPSLVPATGAGLRRIAMQNVSQTIRAATYEAAIPPMPSQSLVRFNTELQLASGESLRLPHSAELRPFESYFVFDTEFVSRLPILWLFERRRTQLQSGSLRVSGVVALGPGETSPHVYDGVPIESSRNGTKIRFLKGEEFRGDRTVNMIPESPRGGTTAGSSSPHREHLSYWLMREMGVLTTRAEWHRVVTLTNSGALQHTQRLIFQQVNEQLLAMNGRDENGYLFKRNYVNPKWETHTNQEEGTEIIDALERELGTQNPAQLRAAMERYLDLDELMSYDVAQMFVGHWDGYHNNHWMYRPKEEDGKWEIIPWDNDKAWGYTDCDSMYTELPVSFPIDGRAIGSGCAWREPGPIYGKIHRDAAFHHDFQVRLRREMSGNFSEDRLFGKIEEVEALLLDDLDLQDSFTGQPNIQRRQQIHNAYELIRTFIRLRREYLDGVLPASVEGWGAH